MNWTFFPRFSRSPAADSHLAPCWGQRRALVRLRPPQRDAADASLAGHLSSGACLVKQSHSQNIKYGKNSNCHLGLVYTTQNLWWFWVVFFLWFTTLLAKKDPRRCTHALYMLCILIVSCTGMHWGEMDSKEDGSFKNWLYKDISSREIGIRTPWSMKDPATFPRKVVFLRTFTDIKMGCPNGRGAFNSMVIWKQALDFSLSKYLQVFPMNILVGSLESWHEHTHTQKKNGSWWFPSNIIFDESEISGIFQVPFGWFAICGGLNLTQPTSRTNERWCLSNCSWFTSNDIPILNSCRLHPIFAIYVWVSWSLRAGWASRTGFNVGKSCSTFGFMELLREFLPIQGFFAFLVFLFSSQGENERWKNFAKSKHIHTFDLWMCSHWSSMLAERSFQQHTEWAEISFLHVEGYPLAILPRKELPVLTCIIDYSRILRR